MTEDEKREQQLKRFFPQFEDNRERIIKECKIAVKNNSYWRVGNVLQKVLHKDPEDKSYHQAIAAELDKTGKYRIEKLPNGDYNIFERHINFKERNWFWIALFAYVIGLLTPTIQKSIQQKILPESNQSEQAIPKLEDSVHASLPRQK